jgi:hypothetical protein
LAAGGLERKTKPAGLQINATMVWDFANTFSLSETKFFYLKRLWSKTPLFGIPKNKKTPSLCLMRMKLPLRSFAELKKR